MMHAMGRMRIFVDCSLVNFQLIPTGIPRVVANYVTHGQQWAHAHDVELIPVVPSASGLLAALPPPRANGGCKRDGALAIDGLYALGHRARTMARHLLYGIDASFPRDTAALYHLDSWISKLASVVVQGLRALRSRQLIEPRSGDIIFCPGQWYEVESAKYNRLRNLGCELVLLVHDILPITHPQYYPSPWRERFKERVLASFDFTSAFFCVSDFSRQSLANFAASNDRFPRVTTALNGYHSLGAALLSRERPDLTRAFECAERPLLMVGSIEPKKQHVAVIECLEEKWRSGYRRPLVIVGRPGWLSEQIVKYIRRSPQLGSMLFWFHDLNDGELDYAYSACHASIFASIAEGFGLPMIEAAMHRKPIIAYRSGTAVEILGHYGVFFDNMAALSGMIDTMEDMGKYGILCEQLQTFIWPDWRQRSETLFDALMEYNRA
jgi:glycosyltransferase involved in cell wall biosynthesis